MEKKNINVEFILSNNNILSLFFNQYVNDFEFFIHENTNNNQNIIFDEKYYLEDIKNNYEKDENIEGEEAYLISENSEPEIKDRYEEIKIINNNEKLFDLPKFEFHNIKTLNQYDKFLNTCIEGVRKFPYYLQLKNDIDELTENEKEYLEKLMVIGEKYQKENLSIFNKKIKMFKEYLDILLIKLKLLDFDFKNINCVNQKIFEDIKNNYKGLKKQKLPEKKKR